MHLEEASTKNKLQDILKILIQFWASAHVFISAKRHLSILNRELKKKKVSNYRALLASHRLVYQNQRWGGEKNLSKSTGKYQSWD